MTIEELRALLTQHFASYRAKHREHAAIHGPRREEELETHERFLDLYDNQRLSGGWNASDFREYLADRQIPVAADSPEYEQLQVEHARASAEYRRFVVQHDRSLKSGGQYRHNMAAWRAPSFRTPGSRSSWARCR